MSRPCANVRVFVSWKLKCSQIYLCVLECVCVWYTAHTHLMPSVCGIASEDGVAGDGIKCVCAYMCVYLACVCVCVCVCARAHTVYTLLPIK